MYTWDLPMFSTPQPLSLYSRVVVTLNLKCVCLVLQSTRGTRARIRDQCSCMVCVIRGHDYLKVQGTVWLRVCGSAVKQLTFNHALIYLLWAALSLSFVSPK